MKYEKIIEDLHGKKYLKIFNYLTFNLKLHLSQDSNMKLEKSELWEEVHSELAVKSCMIHYANII